MPDLFAHLPRMVREWLMETSYVAKIYGDSLRDNFVGFTAADPQRFAQLRHDFDAELARREPELARFLEIESALVEFLPDAVVLARFWAVRDRFRRVVPLATRTSYETGVPPGGDPQWGQAPFVRAQTRALLDVIHANYLVNIGREQSIKRLKSIIMLTFVAVVAIAVWLLTAGLSYLNPGLLVLILAGMIGAILSITYRLQSAVSDDAMAQDGIYELTGLRVGWVGVLMSVFLGGAFAFVLYLIVKAGLIDAAYPVSLENPAGHGPSALVSPALVADPCLAPKSADCHSFGSKMAYRLGLASRADFYKMLILAFLAGFAERLVPDILSRLSKRAA